MSNRDGARSAPSGRNGCRTTLLEGHLSSFRRRNPNNCLRPPQQLQFLLHIVIDRTAISFFFPTACVYLSLGSHKRYKTDLRSGHSHNEIPQHRRWAAVDQLQCATMRSRVQQQQCAIAPRQRFQTATGVQEYEYSANHELGEGLRTRNDQRGGGEHRQQAPERVLCAIPIRRIQPHWRIRGAR